MNWLFRLSESSGRLSVVKHVLVALLWFAFFVQWLTIVPVLIPDQVAVMLGQGENKESITGMIVGAGAVVSLVVASLAGGLSDRLRTVRGRRRPFLISGIFGSCFGLVLLLPFGMGSSLLLYTLAILNLQFWWNWTAGPYAGLVSDVVPEAEQGTASAWINIMSILGTIAGNGLMATLYSTGHPLGVILTFIGINIVCLVLTLNYVSEPPSRGDEHPFDLVTFLRSFYIDPKAHPNFYWVLITRLFANMGIWSVLVFLLFYLEDVIGVSKQSAPNVLSALLGVGALLAIPASLLSIRVAEQYGIVRIVQASNWIMAAAVICYVLIALRPNLIAVVPVMLVFSVAYGAYLAVDWALALKVLPSSYTAGKDMGIWHISMVLPQIVGPLSIGLLISFLAPRSAPLAYTVAFAIGAFWLVLAALLVRRVRISPP